MQSLASEPFPKLKNKEDARTGVLFVLEAQDVVLQPFVTRGSS
ncbi:hypothetical protein HMPREF3036_01272 [Sutterella sp. KLE1602]|nr:hypothetical protein HMPREF3036_01272 [Sutterella sp. KLE1602]